MLPNWQAGLGRSLYLLHLWVGLDEAPHDLRVGHEALGERAVHDLPQHVGVAEHLALHPLLHLHEVGRSHAQVGHPGEAAHRTHAERGLEKEQDSGID